MRSSRQLRRKIKAERPFARRWGYESVKEGGGTLLQQLGTALGALTGLLASRWGLPATASVITGAIVGGTIGSIGKGFIAASVDEMRERREKRATRRDSGGRSGAGAQRGIGHRAGARGQGRSGASLGTGRGGGAPSMMNQVIGKLKQVIAQFDRASTQLHSLMTEMWETQNRVLAILTGSRPDVVLRAHEELTAARHRVGDASTLARQAADDVRAYRSGL